MRDVISHSWLWGLASLALVLGTPLALTASPPSVHRTSTSVARVVTPPFADVDIANAKPGSEGWVVPRRDGTRAVLTVDHDLQSRVRSLFSHYEVPAGGLVAIDPKTGQVLAYVGYEAGRGRQCRRVDGPRPACSIGLQDHHRVGSLGRWGEELNLGLLRRRHARVGGGRLGRQSEARPVVRDDGRCARLFHQCGVCQARRPAHR